MTGKSKRPAHVVRFYGNVDFALDSIASKQIIFVHTSKLNDPFDPYFYFETSFREDYEQLFQYIKKNKPNDIARFKKAFTDISWRESVEKMKNLMEYHKRSTFIFSCSAVVKDQHPRDNLYMWGHYGNGHRGVAIEFDTSKTASLLPRHPKYEQNEVSTDEAWIQVKYAQEVGLITPKIIYDFLKTSDEGSALDSKLAGILRDQVSTKSLVWQKENEWRMLWRNDETKMKIHRNHIPKDAISSIYIGMQASSATQEDILFETRKNFPSARIFKAQKKLGFSELNFTEIKATT